MTNPDEALLDEEADSIINWAAGRAGVIVLAPAVGGTFLIANEIYMMARIGRVYGMELSKATIGGFLAGMAGFVGGSFLAGIVPIPFLSTAVGIGVTYAIGHAAKQWIKDGTPTDVKRYRAVASEARAEADRIAAKLKNDPRRHDPLGDESRRD